MNRYKKRIIAGAAIVAVLALVYWWGGDAPSMRGWEVSTGKNVAVSSAEPMAMPSLLPTALPTPSAVPTATPAASEADLKEIKIKAADNALTGTENGTKEKVTENKTAVQIIESATSAPTDAPKPTEPDTVVISDKELTCTLSVRCDTILDNIEWLDSEKISIVPKDGIILGEQTVTFYEGESVFNLLVREMKKNKIHLEFENVPIYKSAYIEGIANLYEFDCGELSGWMYKVNGDSPNYGSSRYQLKEGDKVEWVYTCDLGADANGYDISGRWKE